MVTTLTAAQRRIKALGKKQPDHPRRVTEIIIVRPDGPDEVWQRKPPWVRVQCT
jgi:hypothetical protein